MSSVDLEADMGSLPHRNDQEGASERPCDEGERVGGVRAKHRVEVRPANGVKSQPSTPAALSRNTDLAQDPTKLVTMSLRIG